MGGWPDTFLAGFWSCPDTFVAGFWNCPDTFVAGTGAGTGPDISAGPGAFTMAAGG